MHQLCAGRWIACCAPIKYADAVPCCYEMCLTPTCRAVCLRFKFVRRAVRRVVSCVLDGCCVSYVLYTSCICVQSSQDDGIPFKTRHTHSTSLETYTPTCTRDYEFKTNKHPNTPRTARHVVRDLSQAANRLRFAAKTCNWMQDGWEWVVMHPLNSRTAPRGATRFTHICLYFTHNSRESYTK